MTSVDRLARDLAGLRREVKAMNTTPRLARSSIDGGALEIRDVYGNTTGYVGEQFDGTFTVAPVGGTYPSAPSPVLVTPRPGGLSVYWDGTYDDGSVTRMDFKRVAIYAVPLAADPLEQEELDLLSPTQNVGEITQASGGEIIVGLPPVEYLIYAVTWTEAGKFSLESDPAFGTPLSVVEQDVFDELDAAMTDLRDVTLPALDQTLADNTAAVAALEGGMSAIETAAQEAKDDAAAALTQSAAAKAAADGAIRTFGPEEYPTTPPWANGSAQDPSVVGDLWLNADGVAHRWNGTTWYVIPDSAAAAALAAAQDAQDVAAAASSAASAAQGEIDTLEGRVVTAEGEIDSVTTRVTTAEGTLTSVAGRVTTAEGAVSNHETRIDTAEGTLTQVDGRLDSAESSISTHETRIDTAEGEVDTLVSSVSTLNGSVSTLTNRISTAEGTLTSIDTRVDTAESTITNHTDRLSTAEGNITSVTNIANGKNKTTYSTAAPGTTANTAGDTWFRLSGSEVIGVWKGNGGTSWTAEKFGGAVLDHLDAGTITAGVIAAERIGALSITTGHLAAGAVTTAKIEAGSIDSTKIVTAGLDAATIKFGTMSGDRIEANSLTIGKVSGLQTTLDAKETPSGAQAKATAAQQAAISAAATDAQTKATNAAAAAEAAAKAYALAEADAAEAAAIAAASGDAASKAAAAQAAAISAAAADALTKANTAKTDAISAAATAAATAYGETKTLVAGWRTTGQTTIEGGAIRTDSIMAAQIGAGQVTASEVATDAIVAGKVAANAIDAREIKAGAVIAAKLAADSVVAGKIAADAIGAREIQADSISTTELQANAVTADRLNATAVDGKTITGAIIRTAPDGQARVEVNTGGLVQYEDIGGSLAATTRIGSGQNKFTGSITAEDIMVQGGLELYGQDNAFGSNSKVTLRTGQGAPAVAPTATAVYQNQAIGTPLTPYLRQLYGYHLDGSTEYGVSEFFAGSRLNRGSTWYELGNIKITKADGSVVERIRPRGYSRIEIGGKQYAAVLGEFYNNGDSQEWPRIGVLWYDDSLMNTSGTVAPTEVNYYQFGNFNWFYNYIIGRGIYPSQSVAAGRAQTWVARHDTGLDTIKINGVEAIAANAFTHLNEYNLAFGPYRVHADEKLIGYTRGYSSDLGMVGLAAQYVHVLNTTHQNLVFTDNFGVRITDQEWPVIPGSNHRVVQSGSITNNTLAYWAHMSGGANTEYKQSLTKYSSWNWSAVQPLHWFSFAWRGHSSKVTPEFLTPQGPTVAYAPVKRAWTRLSMPPLPPPEAGQNAARDVNKDIYGWVVYAGTGATEPARTAMARQAASTGDPSPGQICEFGSGIIGGAAPVISTQGFPSLSPAQIISSAGDGGGAFLRLDGDGNIKAKSLTIGSTSYAPAEVVLARGAGVNSAGLGPRAYKNGPWATVALELSIPGTVAAGDVIVTLPAGYRPATRFYFNGSNGRLLWISTDGTIKCTGAITASALDCSHTYPLAP